MTVATHAAVVATQGKVMGGAGAAAGTYTASSILSGVCIIILFILLVIVFAMALKEGMEDGHPHRD